MISSRKFKAVLFDLDGTILDTTPLILQSFQQTFAELFQRQISLEDIQPFMGKPLRAAMDFLAPGQEELAISTYRKFNEQNHDLWARIFPGVEDTVSQLGAQGIAMAIVTSKTSVMARRGLKLFGIDHWFHPIIGLEDSERHKPDPEPVQKALEILKLPTHLCLMVGDSPHDIASAKAAGLKTAAVRWTHVAWSEIVAAKPDYYFEAIQDLIPLVFENHKEVFPDEQ